MINTQISIKKIKNHSETSQNSTSFAGFPYIRKTTAMKKILPLLFTFLLSGTLSAQENLVPSVLRLTGLPDASDLDGETLD